jgi:hypothetical protein
VAKECDGWLSGIGGQAHDGWLRTGMGGKVGWVAKDRDGWLSGIGGQVQDRWLRTEMCG